MRRKLALAVLLAAIITPGCRDATAPGSAMAGPLDNLVAFGDSFTAGAGALDPTLTYPAVLARLLGRTVTSNNESGGTSTLVADRIVADTAHARDIFLLWMGRNNYRDTTTVKADFARAISALKNPHGRFLVLSVMNGRSEPDEAVGQPGYDAIARLNGILKQLYPANFVDVRSVIVSRYDKARAQDVIDHSDDIPPSSLRYDGIHLNADGYGIVAQTVADEVRKRGW